MTEVGRMAEDCGESRELGSSAVKTKPRKPSSSVDPGRGSDLPFVGGQEGPPQRGRIVQRTNSRYCGKQPLAWVLHAIETIVPGRIAGYKIRRGMSAASI